MKGVKLDPDELILDNLKCVFESAATNTLTKRQHIDWLSEYVNGSMVESGLSESKRFMAAATVRMFYRANDSQLFGAFKIAQAAVVPPLKALRAEDIRLVLSVLPVNVKAPLVCVWQSGIEIGRVLSFRWKDLEGLDGGEYPLKLTLYGRKRHRRTYSTFLGRDSITHLNLRSLLIEGRKTCRKVILITTDWSNFRGIAKVFKPRPWEPSVAS